MHPNVHYSTIYSRQDMEATINSGMNKDAVLTYNGTLLSHKKERNNAIFRDMDGPRDYHTV